MALLRVVAKSSSSAGEEGAFGVTAEEFFFPWKIKSRNNSNKMSERTHTAGFGCSFVLDNITNMFSD